MSSRLITATLVFAAAFATVVVANAQSFERGSRLGKISAIVTDEQGARIAGACVIFHYNSFQRIAKQTDELEYMAELKPGFYSVTAVAPGFDPAGAPNVQLGPGEDFKVNVMLNVAPPEEVTDAAGGRYFGELFAPCGLEAKPRATATTRMLMASAQRRKNSTAATKTQAKTPAKSTTKSPARSPTKTAAKSPTTSASPSGVIQISTQPGAAVWVDEVRRGTTDAEGKLQLKLTPGRHSLRVRANGYAERTLALLPAQRGAISVALTKTADEAELAFQQAETEREKGNNSQAVELYRQALKLRPRYAAAHLGLARALESQEEFDAALEEIAAARRDRPAYAEASAVEGRILRSLADTDGALNSYRRAIREANGFQPEAYTGMGIVHEDKGRYEDAANAFRKAIAQLSDTEPILYELLGRNLERLERWKEAVAAYEKYLALAPEGAHASAINSIIDQLRQQAAESEQQQPPEER